MIYWHYGPMWTHDGAWMAYICLRSGLTDCEWLIPGTVRP